MPEGEWDAFLAQLRQPLPTTFRINGSGRFAADLRDRLTQDFFSQFSERIVVRAPHACMHACSPALCQCPSLTLRMTMMMRSAPPCMHACERHVPVSPGRSALAKQVDGEPLEPPAPLPWYPERLAWHLSFSRAQLRKLPALKAVHELMIRENEAGALTRQEAVSMIPPLLLDVQPSHRVRGVSSSSTCMLDVTDSCAVTFQTALLRMPALGSLQLPSTAQWSPLHVRQRHCCMRNRCWTRVPRRAPRQPRSWRCCTMARPARRQVSNEPPCTMLSRWNPPPNSHQQSVPVLDSMPHRMPVLPCVFPHCRLACRPGGRE